MPLSADVQGTQTDPLVTLYEIDLTGLGHDILLRYTNRPLEGGGNVVFGGNLYALWPIQATGFERKTKQLPTPHIKVSNTDGSYSSLVQEYSDLVGGIFRRIRTFRKYLDDGVSPDSSAIFIKDIFIINQKVTQDNEFVEWECRAATELPGFMLPKRQALRDRCTQIYRFWNGSAFDYSKATCPYTGATYYDSNDVLTLDPSLDRCAKDLTGCHERFDPGALPTWAFPALGITSTQG